METTHLPFQGFNEYAPVRIYHRNLPHWRQDGCSYFVTFRLADSIPRSVIEGWEEERRTWFHAWGLDGDLPAEDFQSRYLAIPEKYRISYERERMAKPLRELDKCHGSCILRNTQYAQPLASAMRHFDGIRLQCGDFAIMPNHVHWVIMPLPGFELEKLLQGIKSYVSTLLGKMNKQMKGKLWQGEAYDRCIRDRQELDRTRVYIENNPSRAKLRDDEYIYHRAGWLDYKP